jgi:hypothetical protein
MTTDDRGDDTQSLSVIVEERGALAVIRINRHRQRNSLFVAALSNFGFHNSL